MSRFSDVNLTQLLLDDPVRDTLEVRVLPGALRAVDVVSRAALVEGLLTRCLDPAPLPPPPAGGAAQALRHLAGLA